MYKELQVYKYSLNMSANEQGTGTPGSSDQIGNTDFSRSIQNPSQVQSAFGQSKFASDKEQNTTEGTQQDEEDKKIAELRKQMEQMEQEAGKLREMQKSISAEPSNQQSQTFPGGENGNQVTDANGEPLHLDIEQRREIDSRSVFVGNVDFTTTPEELEKYFEPCGVVNRITIPTNKFTGNPKGYAYVEFSTTQPIANALQLNESLFKGRMLKVTEKRTNLPGFSKRGHRGRGGRGRGFRGRFRGRARGRGGFKPY